MIIHTIHLQWFLIVLNRLDMVLKHLPAMLDCLNIMVVSLLEMTWTIKLSSSYDSFLGCNFHLMFQLHVCFQICREAEAAIFHRSLYDDLKNAKTLTDATETTCIAAVSASFKVNAAAIISFSTSGTYVELSIFIMFFSPCNLRNEP